MTGLKICRVFLLGCLYMFVCYPSLVSGRAPFFIVRPLGAGFFSEFNLVLGALHHYEHLVKKGLPCAGIHIDFGCEGMYYDSTIGENFWEYYFEPIVLGNRERGDPTEFSLQTKVDFSLAPRYKWSSSRSHRLIRRYVRLKPFMRGKIQNFLHEHFRSRYIIGVHYRGTDKVVEASRVSYRRMYKAVVKHISGLRRKRYRVFVASDEEAFICYMKNKFPGLILTTNIQRSADMSPLHIGPNGNKFKIGEGALLDCLLLAKCNFLIRTSSNLSFSASQFNPRLPCKEMNRAHCEANIKRSKRAES